MSEEATATKAAEHRLVRRRNLKKGVEITARKGALGLGPNLATGGVELSDDGVQLCVKSELAKGDEVEVGLTGIGRSKPMNLMGTVRWCRPDQEEEGFLIGVQFRRRLTYAEIQLFV